MIHEEWLDRSLGLIDSSEERPEFDGLLGADAWSEGSIMDFRKGEVTEFWAGRRLPSRHNTSAPDFTFRDFRMGER